MSIQRRSVELTYDETGTMRPMPRKLTSVESKYSKNTIQSQSKLKDTEDFGGMTYSIEADAESTAAKAEYDVLCAILSRESYLQRLEAVVKTINKKFKPEIADILDLVRSSSLDVIELIKKWRTIKKDNEAVFLWNGLNYLLKMPSDLDYLSNYVAIQKWVGFPLIRNPFCIPFPMQTEPTADEVINLQNIERSDGGKNKKINTSSVYSEDIKRIRAAERVIMDSEAKFGVLSRDPYGRLVPILQALTKQAGVELKKDERRPLNEPAKSSSMYAPHAPKCDVGLSVQEWTPGGVLEDGKLESNFLKGDDEEKNFRNKGKGKIGGELSILDSRGADTFQRKPVKPSIATEMDFRRQRKIKSLQDRIKAVNDLKQELAQYQNDDESPEKKNEVIRSILSSQSVINLDSLQSKQSSTNLSATVPLSSSPSKSSSSPTRATTQTSPQRSRSTSTILQKGKSRKIKKGTEEMSEKDNIIAEYKTEDYMKQIEREISKAVRALDYHKKDEKVLAQMKVNESLQKLRQRARDIERKRRILTAQEGRQYVGPPPEDDTNVYDYYAGRIQCVIRGWLTRCWVKWYREVSTNACILLQSVLRGWFGRLRVRRMRQNYRAAVLIQKNFRGWKTRGTSAAMAKQRKFFKKAIEIQRLWRGILGRRRAESKRKLDQAAKDAFDAVDTKSLVASDVKELAKRIIYAIEEPTTTEFPPDEVLHLIRLSILVIGSARGDLGITDYDFFNVRHYSEHGGNDLTWQQAAKMVNRSERFIRLVRAVAYGPGAKPPRLIQLSNSANLLYSALLGNPRWKVATFENMGMGSRICVQLFKWVSSVVEISSRQQEFLSLIATSFPDWLPKLNELQISTRYCECELELAKKCIELLQEKLAALEQDSDYFDLLETEMKFMKRHQHEIRGRFRDAVEEIDKLKNDQSAREIFALEAMKVRIEEGEVLLRELAQKFSDTLQRAQGGDRTATEDLSEIRHELTNHRLKLSELDAQRKLLEIQVESNRAKRKDPALVPPEILFRAVVAGEAKAAQLVALVDCKAMLKSAGVKDPADLPMHLVDLYDDLAAQEDKLRIVARRAAVELEQARKVFDDLLTRSVAENDLKEQKSKDQMIPTDEELLEERMEDEQEAIAERIKHMQYLPDEVIFDIPERPRPVIIAFSRDLPGLIRQKLFENITRFMPGQFISVDCAENCGFDLISMQKILDAKKSIIMETDHGLTRAHRQSFLTTLEMSLHGLIPNPTFIILVGDEKNLKVDYDSPTCGVPMNNVMLLRDGELKMRMERLELLTCKVMDPLFIKCAQSFAMELSPPNEYLGVVLEAIFVLLNSIADNNQVNPFMRSLTWQLTRQLMIDPMNFIYKRILTTIKRGKSTFASVSCMEQYMKHRFWPSPGLDLRNEDIVLNTLASFIETFVEVELLTLQGGGIPLQSLTKSSVRGIQATITVSDSIDQLPLYIRKTPVLSTLRGVGTISWEQGSYLAVRAALQDMRVMKSVMKIDKTNLFTVSVYRELNQIYIEAYTAQSSEIYLISMKAEDVPAMLVPNGTQLEANSGKLIAPPATSTEMYDRLLKLLRFEQFKGMTEMGPVVKKILHCKRDYTYLRQQIVSIDGYKAILKGYEAALGELFFVMYIPEISLHLERLVSSQDRLTLRDHADKGETKESEIAENMDSRGLLLYMIDRLRLYPKKNFFENVFDRDLEKVKLQFSTNRTQTTGFQLKPQCHGPVGRIVARRVMRFFNIIFLIEVRYSTPTGIVDVYAYEPITSKTLKCRIPKFLRSMMIGDDLSNEFIFLEKLMKLIKIRWSDDYQLNFDTTIFRKTVSISRKKFVFSIQVQTEETILVLLFDSLMSTKYSTELNLSQICELLNAPFDYETYKGTPLSEVKDITTRRIFERKYLIEEFSMEEFLLTYECLELFSFKLLQNLKPVIFEDQNNPAAANTANEENAGEAPINDQPPKKKFKLKSHMLVNHFVYQLPNTNRRRSMDSNTEIMLYRVGYDEAANRKVDKRLRTKYMTTDEIIAADSRKLVVATPEEGEEVSTPPEKSMEEIFIRTRRQLPMVMLELELNKLAVEKAAQALQTTKMHQEAAQSLGQHIQAIEDDSALREAVTVGTKSAADYLLDSIHAQVVDRLRERNDPGFKQTQYEEEKAKVDAEALALAESATGSTDAEEELIVGNDWKFVMEIGVKANFREGKVRWHGHVSVKIYEDDCWVGDIGMGKRYKFVVYEPNVAQSFEGIIRSYKHLREVLGIHGQDLLEPKKSVEMIMFISRYRLEVVVNKKTWDGEDVEEGAPPYRIEFQSDRMYTADKVTPINDGEEDDAAVNEKKLFEISNARGKKIIRMVRRITNVLMQLTVFELPPAVAVAALSVNPIPGLSFRMDSSGNVVDCLAEKEAEERELALQQQEQKQSESTIPSNAGKGYVEERGELKLLNRYLPPAFRIVGYDPRSKRKVTLGVEPQAVVEVSGGIFSPYLNPDIRRDLARIVCESLILHFPNGRPFELVVPWSGSQIGNDNNNGESDPSKLVTIPSADNSLKRKGRIYRSALRISKYELIVSIFVNQATGELANEDIVVNFYSPAVAYAVDINLTEEQQRERIGNTIVSFSEGSVRTAAIRRLCRFFKAEIIEDILDPTIKTLHIVVMPPNMGFVTDYLEVGLKAPGEDVRPVGLPSIFFPLDTCGRALHRRGITLVNKFKNIYPSKKEFLVTVYTKSENENPERGLVIKLYDRSTSQTSILHLGASELMRLCNHYDEPDLLRDLTATEEEEETMEIDEIETDFKIFTPKGILENKCNKLTEILVDIVLRDLCYAIDAQGAVVPSLHSTPKGSFPD